MSDCCTPKGYRWIFSERMAHVEARRYRKSGLDRVSRRIAEFVKAQGVEGRTVLEVGGGIGALQIELLKAGATRATSVELTPTYEEVARELLNEAGLSDRVERKVMDYALNAETIAGADIVIMNRVLCCYPNMPHLAGAAAGHTGRLLVISFPRGSWWMRAGLGFANLLLWLSRREFHIFVHSPRAIMATSSRHGLHPVLERSGLVWTVAALSRTAQTG